MLKFTAKTIFVNLKYSEKKIFIIKSFIEIFNFGYFILKINLQILLVKNTILKEYFNHNIQEEII